MKTRLVATVGRTRRSVQLIALLLVASALAVTLHQFAIHGAAADPVMPTSSALESALGVRFSRVAVVGDGGLVEVSYLVLDADKATRFQSQKAEPPVLGNSVTGVSTKRVSLMKQGHALRSGQTYYFVYLNSGTVRPNDRASLTVQGVTLAGIPVQ